MEDKATRGRGLRQRATGYLSLWRSRFGVPSRKHILPYGRVIGWRELLVVLGLCLSCPGFLGLAQAANPSSTTYTRDYVSTNINLEIPGEDSFDWWGAWYRDMVLISTHMAAISASTGTHASVISTLGTSTNTIASDLTTHIADTAAHSATSANTASRIVARDGSGNFSAGTITASLTGNVTGNVAGNATTASALAANGTNCSAGEYARGVDASGNAENCTSVSASGTIVTSTFTIIQNSLSTTATSAGACHAGSTVTFTAQGGGLLNVVMDGTCSASGSVGANIWCTFLQDGGSLSPWAVTGTSGPFPFDDHVDVSGNLDKCGFNVTMTGPSAGSHSYCLSCFTTAGGGTFSLTNGSRGPLTFGVREFK